VTNFVSSISTVINCSKSTIWLNIKQLKRAELLEYSNSKNKGSPISLTKIGKAILGGLE